MAGTREGSRKAVETIYREQGPDFFREVGRLGGLKSRGGGFAAKLPCFCKLVKFDHHKAHCAGVRGGRKSRRRKKVTA